MPYETPFAACKATHEVTDCALCSPLCASFLDSAGRSSGTQRYFDTNEEHQWYEANRRSEYYFRESHIGIGPHQHPLLNQDSDTDVRLHRFDERSSLPRGLVGNGFDLASQPDWFQYDIPWEQTTLSTRCDPQLLADAACHNLLHPKQEAKLLEGPKELHAVLLCELLRKNGLHSYRMLTKTCRPRTSSTTRR